jgi:hypothetical protein
MSIELATAIDAEDIRPRIVAVSHQANHEAAPILTLRALDCRPGKIQIAEPLDGLSGLFNEVAQGFFDSLFGFLAVGSAEL